MAAAVVCAALAPFHPVCSGMATGTSIAQSAQQGGRSGSKGASVQLPEELLSVRPKRADACNSHPGRPRRVRVRRSRLFVTGREGTRARRDAERSRVALAPQAASASRQQQGANASSCHSHIQVTPRSLTRTCVRMYVRTHTRARYVGSARAVVQERYVGRRAHAVSRARAR